MQPTHGESIGAFGRSGAPFLLTSPSYGQGLDYSFCESTWEPALGGSLQKWSHMYDLRWSLWGMHLCFFQNASLISRFHCILISDKGRVRVSFLMENLASLGSGVKVQEVWWVVGTWKGAQCAAEHRPWSRLADLFQNVWRQNSYVDFHALGRNLLRLGRRFSRESHSFTSLRLWWCPHS